MPYNNEISGTIINESILDKYFEANAIEIDISAIADFKTNTASNPINQTTMSLAKQDNSLIGKIRRLIANMQDVKNTDSSQSFFSRLKSSIQNIIFNQKDNQNLPSHNNIKLSSDNQILNNQQQHDPFQHIDVNPLEAIQKLKEQPNNPNSKLNKNNNELYK